MSFYKIGDLFTSVEISRAVVIWRGDRERFHERVKREIIVPAMARINVKTKQENDPNYLAYMLEYAMTRPRS